MPQQPDPDEGHIGRPPHKRQLLVLTGVALVVGAAVTVGAILPAEYNVDPLGIGSLTGLDRLWSPEQIVFEPPATADGARPLFTQSAVPYREDVIMIPVKNYYSGPYQNELEYKLRMQQGTTITFSWIAAPLELADDLYFEFHGHTLENEQEMTVASYQTATIDRSAGSFTAPFDGVHGWYFQNSSDKDIVVELHVSGFYELVPPGEVGNLGRVVANVPAERAIAP